jgi:hypothetical protein
VRLISQALLQRQSGFFSVVFLLNLRKKGVADDLGRNQDDRLAYVVIDKDGNP